MHIRYLFYYSSEILKVCTKPGMLSRLDYLDNTITIQEYFEIDSLFDFLLIYLCF